jgi:hypothetical protein
VSPQTIPTTAGAVVVCLACRRDLPADAGHAVEAAGLHDEARHGGRPVAFLAPDEDGSFGGDAA